MRKCSPKYNKKLEAINAKAKENPVMLKFLLHYPIGSYAKSLFSPKAKGPDMGFYFGGDKNQILIEDKKHKKPIAWEPNLKTFIGAPSLNSICRSEADMGNPHVPSSFRKEIGIPNKLQTGNDCLIIFEDTDVYIGLQTLEGFSTVGSIRKSLEEDPSEIISLWASFNNKGDYHWEILDTAFRTMGNKEKTPSKTKVFLIGYPEEKIRGICRWSRLFNCQITNLLPSLVAVSQMIHNHEENTPPVEGNTHHGSYFLIFNGAYETCTIFFTRRECLVFSMQRTTEGTNTNEISNEIEDIRDQEELPYTIPIHTWGLPPDNYLPDKLKAEGWTNIKNWDAKTLNNENPILEDIPSEGTSSKLHLQSSEPWLLNFHMR